MPSIIEGYEYDIFISYRQKDNKYDGWVTEFVDNLKRELEATFKEDISIYFDANPKDGLLETHIVDESLEKKLKCLIFIPIISQTYCDSKSFAWQHEFCTFNKLAKEDQFGRDIRLARGNVTSRILPIKIHDLDPEDKTLLENELGGVLRCIEFIYKSAGVNRPLRANEDHPQDNLNKTYYRDQINKVANAVKEIITAIKNYNQQNKEVSKEVIKAKPGQKKNLKTKFIIVPFFVLALIVLGYFFMPKLSQSSEPVIKSIAVLPFKNDSPDEENTYFINGVMEEILTNLQTIKGLRVISRPSVEQYRNRTKAIPEIAKELKVNYIVVGSGQKYGNTFKLRVQLIRAAKESQIWAKSYEQEIKEAKDIFSIQNQIAKQVADKLETVITPEEIEQIDKNPTTNFNAYSKFLSGNFIYNDAAYFVMMGKKYNDSSSFENAIKAYDRAIEYDSAFALAYAKRAITRSWGYFTGSLDQSNIKKCKEDIDKALKIDSKLTEAQIASGFYYYYCKKDYKKAIEYFQKAADQEPGNWEPVFYMALVHRRIGEWTKSQILLTEVLKYNPQDALILTNIGISYDYVRNYDSALIYHNRAIKFMPNWSAPYSNKIKTLILKDGITKEARNVLDTAMEKTGKRFQEMKILLDIYDSRFREALHKTDISNPSDFYDRGDKLLLYALIHNYLNNPDMAKIYYDSARVFFIKKLKDDPENATTYSQLGYAYAGLKNRVKAVEAGGKAVKLTTDPLSKSDKLIELSQIYIMVGDYDQGFRQIEYLLKNPSHFSTKLLQLDPVWKPILEKPEFKKILIDYSKN